MRCALLLCLCGLASSAHAKKPKSPAPSPAATAGPPKEALLAAADEITRQVAALRGLKVKAPIQKGVLSRDAIGGKLKERLAKEYTPEEVRGEARVLKRLGLLPQEADYEKLIIDLLMEQVAGFYDPFVTKLFIADWLPLEMQRPALAHEIQHALQDQHFDLKRFASPIKDNGDMQLAHSALVEGDGTAVMLEFQAQAMGLPPDQLPELVAQIGKQMLQGGVGQTPLFDAAPAFLRETLIFPYLSGLLFVEHVRRTQPWTAVDEIWKSPPESTEQVLHPEKYFAKEHPIKIAPAPLPSLKKKELRRDVLGELEWKIWLQSKLPEAEAVKAAAGWGGDRMVAYSSDGEVGPTVINLSVWDTEGDAKEAAEAARKLVAKLSGRPDAPASSYTDAKGEVWSVERRGEKLLVVCGVPADSHTQVVSEVWSGWKVTR
jgi:hypothetical protein